MAKTITLNSILIALIISSSISAPLTEAEAEAEAGTTTNGFTVDLIHRDSPQSPSYNSSLSNSQRIYNSLLRSFNRLQHFNNHASKSPSPEIIDGGGEYFVKYSVGSPPVAALGIADTGSDVIWNQCQPCMKCVNQTLPVFQPKNSRSYRRIPCNSPNCKSFQSTMCSKRGNNCLYSESYGDGSFTQGELATDIFIFGSVGVPNILFGCGFRNGVVFQGGQSGIVGLGGGKVSLVRQLGPLAQGKFSYCLTTPFSNNSNSGKLNFGGNAVVSGVKTPLVKKDPDTFYYVTLEGISVGNQRLKNSSPLKEGNMIVDSGTTLTMLHVDLYNQVVKALEGSIKLRRVEDPNKVLDLCYFTREDVKIGDVVVHFRGGDVKLSYENVFVRTSDDTVCFAAKPTKDVGVYGNLAQINFLVGFDLKGRSVTFRPTHCGK